MEGEDARRGEASASFRFCIAVISMGTCCAASKQGAYAMPIYLLNLICGSTSGVCLKYQTSSSILQSVT